MVTYAHAHAHALERPCKILGTMSENYCSFYEKCSDMMLESFWHFFHYKKCKIRIFSSFFFQSWENLMTSSSCARAHQSASAMSEKYRFFFKNTTMTLESLMYFFTKKEWKRLQIFFSFCKFEKIWRCLSISLVHTRARTHARARVRVRAPALHVRAATHASKWKIEISGKFHMNFTKKTKTT